MLAWLHRKERATSVVRMAAVAEFFFGVVLMRSEAGGREYNDATHG